MSSPNNPPPQEAPTAETRFADFLRRKEAGDTVSFEEFCANNPSDETALRMLHSVYEEGKSAAEAPSLGHKLEKFFGATMVEKSSLDSLVSGSEEAGSRDSAEKLVTHQNGPRYEEKGEIARGGMGIVFRVLDRDLNRQLAMKVLQSSQTTARSTSPARPPPEHLSRFLEEAQVTAQLDHPGIVPVHELGVDAYGRVYFTMQLVKGRSCGRFSSSRSRRKMAGACLERSALS